MSQINDDIKAVKPEGTDVIFKNGVYKVFPYVSVWNKEKKRAEKHLKGYIGIIEKNEEGKYVFKERESSPLSSGPEVKTYGDFSLLDKIGKDLHDELVSFYGKKDGEKIYVYSLLRIISGDSNSYLEDEYDTSYISSVYPDVAMSKNSILSFIKTLGSHDGTNHKFLKSRIKENHKVLIFDGTRVGDAADAGMVEFGKDAYKTNNSQFIKIRVFDTENREPLYYEVVPGNVVDKTSFIEILGLFNIKDSIIVVDRGFNSRENVEYLMENGYSFIMPLNDNAKKKKELLSSCKYTNVFKMGERSVKGFKKKDKIVYENDEGEKKEKELFLYTFNDPKRASAEENRYISDIIEGKRGKTVEELNKKKEHFGSIVFYSNLDIDIEKIYYYYNIRWEIEDNFRLEKSTLENEAIRVHSTLGIYGVNFLIEISNLIVTKLYNYLDEKGLINKYSVKRVLKKLSKTFAIYRSGKWRLSITTKGTKEFMKMIGVETKI